MRLLPSDTSVLILLIVLSSVCRLRSLFSSEVNKRLRHKRGPLFALWVPSTDCGSRLRLTLIYLLLNGFFNVLLLVVLYLALTLVVLVSSSAELVVVLEISQGRAEGSAGLLKVYVLARRLG